MAQKRMNTFIVTLRFPLPDGATLTRKIAENGLTSQSAKNKVIKHYKEKGWKFTVISVVRKVL